jgi:hypothetical protein
LGSSSGTSAVVAADVVPHQAISKENISEIAEMRMNCLLEDQSRT